MSFPTTPAFVHVGTWNDETRKHPAMKWMEEYTLNFNKRGDWNQEESDWVSPTLSHLYATLQKPYNSTITPLWLKSMITDPLPPAAILGLHAHKARWQIFHRQCHRLRRFQKHVSVLRLRVSRALLTRHLGNERRLGDVWSSTILCQALWQCHCRGKQSPGPNREGLGCQNSQCFSLRVY
jgi:hypothetical protein